MKTYTKWDDVPDNLKTITQLKQLAKRLATGQEPAARFHSRYYHKVYDLYDQNTAIPARSATENQLSSLAAGREAFLQLRTCPGCGDVISPEVYSYNKESGWQYVCKHCHARRRAIGWASRVIGDSGAIILDTETTGLDGDAEIIEIAAIDITGAVLLDTLVKPAGEISPGASAVHGITAEMVATAPAWPVVYDDLARIITGASRIITYNADFDTRVISTACKSYGLRDLTSVGVWQCAMKVYAAYIGEWSEYHRSYRWQKLEGGHRAAGDCLACLRVIKEMTNEESEG